MFYIFHPHSGGGRIWGMKKLVIIFLLCFSTGLFADYLIKGSGHHGCADLISNDHSQAKEQYKQWLLGYVSGLNLATQQKKGEGINEDGIYYLVLNHCKQNPLENISGVAKKIYDFKL